MSILSSLFTGVSGLRANGRAIEIIGDNIANVNTHGFKAGRIHFADLLSSTTLGMGGRPSQLGRGVGIAAIDEVFGQGGFDTTGVATDLGISGNGLFAVRGNVNGVSGTFFTRAGAFHLDGDGRLVSPFGFVLQGYLADATGALAPGVTDLDLDTGSSPPAATATVDMSLNLQSDATAPGSPFSVADLPGTSNYSTSLTVYDSLGNAHTMDVYFAKDPAVANTWEWHAVIDGAELVGGTPGAVEVGSGSVSFTTDGLLDNEAVTTAISVDFAGGATGAQPITLDFGTSITGDGGTGADGTVQHAGFYDVRSLAQDGFGAGSLVGVLVESDGSIHGRYTNGQERLLGRVAVARFGDLAGLTKEGSSLWGATKVSGDPLFGNPGEGGRGSILSGALEQSNVDMVEEFVKLIAHQRGFQANARTITTADEMLLEVANLKR